VHVFLCRDEALKLEEVKHYDPKVYAAAKKGPKPFCTFLNSRFDAINKKREDDEDSDEDDDSMISETVRHEDGRQK
jgi:hypothetical protein